MTGTYETEYERYRATTEQKLDELLCEHNIASSVLEAMRYSLLGGGKRVRAVLCLSACELCGGQPQDALLAACAVEMLHAYSLIHDDLPCMDDDDLRRGRPSCHKAYGEATALLAGDGLLTLAFSTLARIRVPEAALRCVSLLAEAGGYLGMIRGQELDLRAETLTLSLDELNEVHRHKTGDLICASTQMGAVCAGACAHKKRALEEYARHVGLVFQIVDDILNVTSDASTLGKPVGSDAENNKSTYPSLIGLDASRARAAELTAQATDLLRDAFGSESAFLTELAQHLLTRIN